MPQESTGLAKLTEGTSIKWGEKAIYECVNKANYQEILDVVRINIFFVSFSEILVLLT